MRTVQGDDANAAVSKTRNGQSASETNKPEMQADEPHAAAIGEGKATQESEAVITNITTGSLAFLDVKMKTSVVLKYRYNIINI